jgi:NADPH:quinone reductase-like Zn-dependent oxidoreductase
MSYPSNGIPGTTGGVVTNAASRELQRVHTGKLVPVPRDMPNEVAAGFVLGAQTAYGMVRRLAVQPGEKVPSAAMCAEECGPHLVVVG